jgi:hypothetical protein
LLERRLPPDLAVDASPEPAGPICCAPALLTWQAGYVTADGSRAFLVARAPDLESVRIVLRRCGADVRWRCEVADHVLDASITPNMAFELLIADRLDVDAISAMVRSCAPGSTPARILADVSGSTALVLARTQCRVLKPTAGVVLKSYQSLAANPGGVIDGERDTRTQSRRTPRDCGILETRETSLGESL